MVIFHSYVKLPEGISCPRVVSHLEFPPGHQHQTWCWVRLDKASFAHAIAEFTGAVWKLKTQRGWSIRNALKYGCQCAKMMAQLRFPNHGGSHVCRLGTGFVDRNEPIYWRVTCFWCHPTLSRPRHSLLLSDLGALLPGSGGWTETALKFGGFLKWGYPFIAGWFVMEHPIEMDDLVVPPWLRKPPFNPCWWLISWGMSRVNHHLQGFNNQKRWYHWQMRLYC